MQDNYAATLTYSEGTTASFFTQIELEGVPANSKFIPARASTLDLERIAYFGLSVVWRGHVAKCLPDCSLGPRGESFRQYLRSEASVPRRTALLLVAYVDDPSSGVVARTITMPKSMRVEGYYEHMFFVCGLQFIAGIGSDLPLHYRQFCVLHGATPRVLVTKSSTVLHKFAALARSAEGVGRLRDG
ncbi:MAG TPA: hypothetical protein VJR89_24655 [Polyangiales bacterium]|nr:hypothetical protein [Polyangiales bacterium]